MPMIPILFLSVTFFNQTPLLIESFTDEQFPPVGWDTSYSAQMNAWYRYNYTGTSGPDSFQARVRVYDANDTLRTGYSTLKTLVLDLSTVVGSESLYFWYRFSQETSNLGPFDTMYIDITNDGVNWNNLMKIKQGDDTNVWQIAHLDLSPYDSYSSARIRFHYEDRPNGQLGTWNCNFWLDSVKVLSYFVDTIPPTVDYTVPAMGDTGVGVSSNILIYFDEPIDQNSIIPEAFNVQGNVSGIHTGNITYDSIQYMVQFNPTTNFSYAETVYVTVYDTIMDLAGNRLDGDNNGIPGGDYIFWFFTASSPDTIPPAAVNDLSTAEIGGDWVKLLWTAPGDDGNTGQASYYDIRYSTFAITEQNFYSAIECYGEPLPSLAGQTDSFTVTGLSSQTYYFFALKTADEDSNWSLISNVPSCTTAATLETLLVINEFFVDPETFDHNANGNFGDADEEFIEVFNKDVNSINLDNFQIRDFVGTNTLTVPNGFTIPAYGYLLLYASGEGYIISGDLDTVITDDWSGTWPTLDQVGDTIMLLDNLSRELDRKGYTSDQVIPNYSFARLPNGSETWINNAFPTPGRSNGEEYIWPIAQAFRDLDSNYIPDLLDSVVTVTGVITAPPGIFYELEAYIQDNTGGVALFGDFPITLDYGDSIIATGTIDQYNGKNELTDFTYSLIAHNATIPGPIEIDGSILNTEQYEGSLVKVKISYFDGFLMEGDENYVGWDTLNIPFIVRIDENTNIPGNFAPIDTFTLTGIKGQYTYSTPPTDGYQLLPRDIFDFSHLFIMPEIKNIAEVQSPGTDGVSSKYVDSIVAVEGVVTGPNYVFTTGSPSFYIQDETGGINIYNPDGDNTFNDYIDSLGARIRVIGWVTEYNGLTEVALGYGWFVSMDTVPLPKELAQNQFLTEGMEGSLIKLKGVVKTTPYETGPGYNFDVLNGDVGITVRFTPTSGINPSSILKNEEKIITGIVGQYDPEEPFTTGYQVLLRFGEDLGIPGYDSASAEPLIDITGPKTFIPAQGELAEIKINSPLDYRLELCVYDMNGRRLKELYSGAGGPRTIYWDGKNETRRPCKIGIYLLNLKATAPDGKAEFKRNLVVLGTQF